ncbi:MAG: stage II sporulation protein R [Oscillospiraceae bacterium]|nr:stage II sporulation protein R [Oscillospiraceae bacterium]
MKLKIWELSLFVALMIAILWGVLLDGRQQGLSDQLIRLHVVAHSDSAADQELKYAVRDQVYTTVLPLLEGATTRIEAEARIAANLGNIQAATETIAGDVPVQATLTRTRFPTRAYDTFTLPAGQYSALQIALGGAAGQNWWCVVFPPLCLDAARGSIAIEAAGFCENEVALIDSSESGYAIRFRTLEIADGIRALLGW